MDNPTCHHRIISLLKEKDGITKIAIVKQLPYTIHTVTKALSQLKRAELIREFNSFWYITETGKLLPDNFGFQYFKDPTNENGNEARRVFWHDLIDWEFVENSSMLRQMLNSIDHLEGWEPIRNYLLPYVLTFLAASGIKINKTFESEAPEWNEEKEGQFMRQFTALARSFNDDGTIRKD